MVFIKRQGQNYLDEVQLASKLAITLKYMVKDLWAQKTKGIQGDVPQVIFLS